MFNFKLLAQSWLTQEIRREPLFTDDWLHRCSYLLQPDAAFSQRGGHRDHVYKIFLDVGILDFKLLSQSIARDTKELSRELLFANNCALLAHSKDALQTFSVGTEAFLLTITLKKTEPMMFWKAPRGRF